MEMTDVQLKADVAADGWVRIWAVGNKGRILHTEPVCVVPMNYHQWFIDWICAIEDIPMQMPALLEEEEMKMPNGEGIVDPRFAQADSLRSLMLGFLAGVVNKSFISEVTNIVEVNPTEGWFMLQTSEGNYKVEITVSF